ISDERDKRYIFFFQAEDGIRDRNVTGVQTCALPISMHQTLDNLMEIYDYLDAYGIKDHIVADLSLINHMDYYSDIIFQGFIEKVGKPVLMGGRYNTLANQFNANIPAVGFACN